MTEDNSMRFRYVDFDRDIMIREAEEEDAEYILKFMRELAEFEQVKEPLTVTEEDLRRAIFDLGKADCLMVEVKGKVQGTAIYYEEFHPFTGETGLFLKELYLRDEVRGMGIGKKVIEFLEWKAQDRGASTLEWHCMTFNETGKRFYEKIGAQLIEDRLLYRKKVDVNLDKWKVDN